MAKTEKEFAIKINHISKSFHLPTEKAAGLKQAVMNRIKGIKGFKEQHVLRDIDFVVEKGDFIGIVGRNGSGKSTLLKIISKIYQPTSGNVEINGSIVSFIELGVGFNSELTGHENIYLNDALLGFSTKEIDEMYSSIVDFSELGDFMGQKLKNYSSGMQVRLAFACAIQAKSDVLVLDEVLAVGDEAFQRKCNDYFEKIRKEKDKTVVLVTHSMDAVRKYCNRAVMIRDGKIIINGTPKEVSDEYTQENFKVKDEDSKGNEFELGLSERVPYFKVKSKNKETIQRGEDVVFDVEYKIADSTPINVKFTIRDTKRGVDVLQNGAKAVSGAGKHSLRYVFPTEGYNSMELIITAVLDEEKTGKRIAHTNDQNSARVIVNAGDESNGGLINKLYKDHGYWEAWHDL